MEFAALGLFCVAFVVCVICNVSVLYALLMGLAVFCAYAKYKKYSAAQIFHMITEGIKTAKNVLIVQLLIGVMTALWRSCGAIALITCCAAEVIHPSSVVLMAFLLNCGVSVLMGTALGTVATMGVICMTMGTAMGVNPIILGGAIL